MSSLTRDVYKRQDVTILLRLTEFFVNIGQVYQKIVHSLSTWNPYGVKILKLIQNCLNLLGCYAWFKMSVISPKHVNWAHMTCIS